MYDPGVETSTRYSVLSKYSFTTIFHIGRWGSYTGGCCRGKCASYLLEKSTTQEGLQGFGDQINAHIKSKKEKPIGIRSKYSPRRKVKHTQVTAACANLV